MAGVEQCTLVHVAVWPGECIVVCTLDSINTTPPATVKPLSLPCILPRALYCLPHCKYVFSVFLVIFPVRVSPAGLVEGAAGEDRKERER